MIYFISSISGKLELTANIDKNFDYHVIKVINIDHHSIQEVEILRSERKQQQQQQQQMLEDHATSCSGERMKMNKEIINGEKQQVLVFPTR